MSEDNKQSAEQCLAKACEAIRDGDKARARRLLEKSIRLFDTPKARALLKQLDAASSSSSTPKGDDGPTLRRRQSSTDSNSSSTPPSSSQSANFTPEQEQLARSVVRKKDYYDMLDLQKDCSETDIKKAYRKMALKLHPDKNRAPSAEEAFKCVSKAYECLSDSQKRSMYDQVGPEGMERRAQGGHGFHGGHPFGGGEELNPEDIFNMFFGGGFPGGPQQRGGFRTYQYSFGGNGFQQQQRQRRTQQDQGPMPWYAPFMQFLPVIAIILFMTLFNGMDSSGGNIYSMSRTSSYSVMRQTRDFGIKYYVTPNFQYYYANNPAYMKQTEDEVLQSYASDLEKKCKAQETARAEAISKAQTIFKGSTRELDDAYSSPVTACEELDDLYRKFAQ